MLSLEFLGLTRHYRQDLFVVPKKCLEFCDSLREFLVLVFNALSFQGCQATELHLQDGLGLLFIQVVALHQGLTRSIDIVRVAD